MFKTIFVNNKNYFPWISILTTRVADTLYNPFGEDDDDFELNELINRLVKSCTSIQMWNLDPPSLPPPGTSELGWASWTAPNQRLPFAGTFSGTRSSFFNLFLASHWKLLGLFGFWLLLGCGTLFFCKKCHFIIHLPYIHISGWTCPRWLPSLVGWVRCNHGPGFVTRSLFKNSQNSEDASQVPQPTLWRIWL